MSAELYLDSARLGRMCPGARKAEHAFATLASQLGSSLYLERFLTDGYKVLPGPYRWQMPGLHCWTGVAGLKQDLGRFLGQSPALPMYFFGQSRSLIRFAAARLVERSSRVLVTDLEWPPYVQVLRSLARRRGVVVHIVPLRDLVFREKANAEAITHRVVQSYIDLHCDGAFVADITCQGVRLPVESICPSLRDLGPSFVVIDGAQTLGHRPVDVSKLGCDLLLAGTQKWFGAYHPLRMAICGNAATRQYIMGQADSYGTRPSADPLWTYCEVLCRRQLPVSGETVNVLGLIAAAGALNDHFRSSAERAWQIRQQNASMVAAHLSGREVALQAVHPSLQAGVLLINSPLPADTSSTARERLLQHHIVVSEQSGALRLSMPCQRLKRQALSHLAEAVKRCVFSGPRPLPSSDVDQGLSAPKRSCVAAAGFRQA